MKRILITGANSYIGTSFEKWMSQWSDQYQIDTVDMRCDNWREMSFKSYDVVFHVAGIAHVDNRKATKETQDLYYKINRDLAIETAAKSKQDGVKQFVFMSSIIVYGNSAPIGEKRVITAETIPQPSDFYGDSKLQAENGIRPMQNKDFNVVILRPPMIYGKASKGNYPKLSKAVQSFGLFPRISNARSMLYIDNLCEFIRLIIDNEDNGIFYPQNREYVDITNMVSLISEVHRKKLKLVRIFNPIIILAGYRFKFINKIFGSLIYDPKMSDYKVDYRVVDFKESIIKTEE